MIAEFKKPAIGIEVEIAKEGKAFLMCSHIIYIAQDCDEYTNVYLSNGTYIRVKESYKSLLMRLKGSS